ncbi:MAG TPA: ergothioneine biosynthesis protein EgtB [Thermoanaerobaculia bacterium]|nr:ergothioneine biosynthesis protein EgtB [Thermoanaerobaculia bacterium]
MERESLIARLRATRSLSVDLARPLRAEDYRIQSMPDVSPPWWNLGHTTWFFAKNVLEPHGLYAAEDARLEYVLNSYYEMLGPRVDRAERGLQTRPTTEEIYAFRERTDERLERLLRGLADDQWERAEFLVETGIHHEQQHQELFVTEIKHILGSNARNLREPYLKEAARRSAATAAPCRGAASRGAMLPSEGSQGMARAGNGAAPLVQIELDGGLDEFGNREGGWCFDNELAVHRAWLEPFAVANRLITNGEYLEFMADGGYQDPLLWLANGWAAVKEKGLMAPLYWERVDGEWLQWTLAGMRALALDEPACHVSFYEADAFARWLDRARAEWSGCRLTTEREWERAARTLGFGVEAGNFLESGRLHPEGGDEARAGSSAGEPSPSNGGWPQAAGEVWEWTSSHYDAYPGYVPFGGSLTEYNGKFMDNQRVLRGGSCATPRSHIRVSYRNFWPPDTRFQFTGIRLARPLDAAGPSDTIPAARPGASSGRRPGRAPRDAR